MPTLVSTPPQPHLLRVSRSCPTGRQQECQLADSAPWLMGASEGPSRYLMLPQRLFPWEQQIADIFFPPRSEIYFLEEHVSCHTKKWLFRPREKIQAMKLSRVLLQSSQQQPQRQWGQCPPRGVCSQSGWVSLSACAYQARHADAVTQPKLLAVLWSASFSCASG